MGLSLIERRDQVAMAGSERGAAPAHHGIDTVTKPPRWWSVKATPLGDATGSPAEQPGRLPVRLVAAVTRRRWLVSFILFTLLAWTWAFTVPLFSAPDEPAHVVYAAAVTRGQLVQPRERADSVVRVPQVLASSYDTPGCYAFHPEIPAGCARSLTGSRQNVSTGTIVGRYPPLYYAIVGAPTRVFPSAVGVYCMRLIGGLLSAGFLAGALSAAAAARRPWLLISGVAVGITPMALYLTGVVNPNALETAAALCLWTCALVLAEGPPGRSVPGLVAAAGVSACTLSLTRGLGPLWLACIAVLVLTVTGRARGRQLGRRRDVRRWLVAGAACSIVAMTWTLLAGTLEFPSSPTPLMSLGAAFRLSLGRTDAILHQLIGVLGWLDTPVPALTTYVWLFVAGLLVLLALAAATRRQLPAVLCLTLLVVLAPVALEAPQARHLGMVWQGRYTLPLAVGLPVLCAYTVGDWLDRGRVGGAELPQRLGGLLIALTAAGQLTAFLWALRRYTVGLSGGIVNLWDGRWQPPPGLAAVIALFSLGIVALVGWMRRLSGATT
jgi:hypothetical protein